MSRYFGQADLVCKHPPTSSVKGKDQNHSQSPSRYVSEGYSRSILVGS